MQRLRRLDLSKDVSKAEYQTALKKLQIRLLQQQLRLLQTKRSLILVFEGPDASGKGGLIKRLTEHLDPRSLRVYSILKPTTEEYRHHYMWRFWTKLPSYGEVAIFDRSWYGRVLVERAEKFATEAEWKRAYREINEFERQLTDDGAILLKFYLSVSKEEQLKRFRERAADPAKYWKITEEDWRNRRKWESYLDYAQDMFNKTDKRSAPWHLIEANSKSYARLKVLKLLVGALDRQLKLK